MWKSAIFLLLGVVMFSCSSVKIVHVSQLKKVPKHYWVYALPKTAFHVTVTVEKTVYVKGPYAEFAAIYLGIEQVPQKNYVSYRIKDVIVNNSLLADSEQLFIIKYHKHFPWQSMLQTYDGIILSLNGEEEKNDCLNLFSNTYIQPSDVDILYTEVSKSPIVKEKIDTIYKQVKSDTLWVRVPVQRKSTDTLRAEDKAKEAANFLFDLRSRMYDLFSGDMESLPEGEAADFIAQELRRQEQEYLELFIGKTFKTTEQYTFNVIPTANEQTLYPVAYFSETKGLSPLPENDREPILLRVVPFKTFKPLLHQLFKLEKAKEVNAFYLKFPERALVQLEYDNELLMEQECWFYQTGRIQKIPVSVLKRNSYHLKSNSILVK